MEYRGYGVEYILVELPFFVKFSDDFPKGYIVEKKELTNVYKINGMKLLDWLHKKGYSSYNSKMLIAQTKAYEILSKKIDRMFDNIFDVSFEGDNND